MRLKREHLILLIAFLLPISLFIGSNTLQLRAEEPRRAIVALEMFISGNYLVPKINGWDYYNKPPLFNWLIALCFLVFDSFNEWVVRFPSLLSFLLTGFFHYFICRKYFAKQTALLASLFFLTSADILFYGTINAGEIDLFYSLLVYLQVTCIFIFYERQNYLLLFLTSYLFTALGVLTKGPPSLVFQAFTLLGWFIYNKDFKRLFYWQHIAGILLLVVLSGGYFYAYAQQADLAGLVVRLTKEATQRSGLEGSMLDSVKGALTFPLLLLQLLLPWSVLVFLFFRRDFSEKLKANRLLMFCAVFILCNIPVYWFTGELRNRYIYMFFPFIATLLAYFIQERGERFEKLFDILTKVAGVGMLLTSAAFLVLPLIPYTRTISFIWVKALLFSVLGFGIAIAAFKDAGNRTLLLVLFLVLLRFALSAFYYPVTAAHTAKTSYRAHAEVVLKIAEGEQIYWAENPYVFKSELGIGPFRMEEAEHVTAALLAYEIPYYITRKNKKIMQFETTLQAGKLYLTTTSFCEGKSVEVLYIMHDNWMQRDLLLVRAR